MEDVKEKVDCAIWINWETRVVSFRKTEGFQELRYPTHEDMLRFAIERGFEGFGIQWNG